MLRRKFEPLLRDFLKNSPDKILLVNGARQIGKSYIIRYVCGELFPNYVEIDLRAAAAVQSGHGKQRKKE